MLGAFMPQNKDYTRLYLRRRDNIPDDNRTKERDKAARGIEELWGLPLGQIASRTGFSRPHIKNVVDSYFELYEPDDAPPDAIAPETDQEHLNETVDYQGQEFEVPANVEHGESYILGRMMAQNVEHPGAFFEGFVSKYRED